MKFESRFDAENHERLLKGLRPVTTEEWFGMSNVARKCIAELHTARECRMVRVLHETEHYFDDMPVDDGSQSVGIVAWDGDE